MRYTRPYVLLAIAWSALVTAQQVNKFASTSHLDGFSSLTGWRDGTFLHSYRRYHHPCLLRGQVMGVLTGTKGHRTAQNGDRC